MTDRNIVDLAHAVLDAVVPDVPWKIQLQEFQARAAAAPTLARTVIDLTAKVERVEALADLLDDEANRMGSRGGAFTARAFDAEIRAALSGGTA